MGAGQSRQGPQAPARCTAFWRPSLGLNAPQTRNGRSIGNSAHDVVEQRHASPSAELRTHQRAPSATRTAPCWHASVTRGQVEGSPISDMVRGYHSPRLDRASDH
jgi:hypothetical protein